MIKKVVTHFRPHADELVARMILREFREGEEKFPGIKEASTEFLSNGKLPDEKTWQDFPDTVFLGVGGGPFDEHATDKKERTENEVCATLVAKYLGVENVRALQKILFFVKREDLEGIKVKNELPMIIKFLHQAYKENPEEVARWTELAYKAYFEEEKKNTENLSDEEFEIYKKTWEPLTLESATKLLREHKDFSWWKKFVDDAMLFRERQFEEAKFEFRQRGKTEKIIASDGKPVVVSFVESDNEEMNKFVRSIGSHVVVQKNSRGNYAVMTDRKRGVNLSYAFMLLRMAEEHYRALPIQKDETLLQKEGYLEGEPFWYLFHTKDMGFNGSLTTKDIEPTKIPENKVFEIIKEGLKQKIK